ncbi:MAG: ATP-binding protein [Candidatus Nomurabacteria bacterium]|jgi:predicted AAA+ superfamily ATPase|nr:ATP-binding protein [Candidatus Nomurabacteria bacterium]
MERKIYQQLEAWKKRKNHKPLIVEGARQVGKTFAVKKFGADHFKEVIEINFESNKLLSNDFNGNLDPQEIVSRIEAYFQQEIVPEETLLFFDEIQANENAVTALKYFYEKAPEYHIIAAGSLLGVAMNRKKMSFPVGKVEFLSMCPLDFEEFIWALGYKKLAREIRRSFQDNAELGSHELGLKLYKEYLVVGGMPEVVAKYTETGSFIEAAATQDDILNRYAADMAKYADDEEIPKILASFDSIPAQLAKENHKFQYKIVQKGGTAAIFGQSINWLSLAGIVMKCQKIEQARIPLKAFRDLASFKLYALDIGLLLRMSGISPHGVLNDVSSDFMGGLTENYVAQALFASGTPLYYWASGGQAEIDFVMADAENKIIPIEVKAGKNTRSRSLSVFREIYQPERAVRISTKNFGFENGIKSVPLYAVFCFGQEF